MDQKKIGQFIAICRKEQGLTQVQLAEQLGITNRAVSKWETAKSMPDVSVMMPLCEILDISVNELLSGEKIRMEEFREKADETVIQIERQKQITENVSKYSFGIVVVILLVWNLINVYCYGIQESITKPVFFILCMINIVYFSIYIILSKRYEK